MYEFRRVREHIEVFLNVEFLFSADTMSEARKWRRFNGDLSHPHGQNLC